MNSYTALSEFYDELTNDVPYSAFADYYEELFRQDGGEFKLLLDLCCGTGSLTLEMAKRSYEMISVDMSPDMLIQAMTKANNEDLETSPLFICQSAQKLDLYGTVDACYSSLDSFSYIEPKYMAEVFRRLHLFIRPAGLLVFDIRSPEFLRLMDGSISVDERENYMCIWRGSFEEDRQALLYGMDIFIRDEEDKSVWFRQNEEHYEYVHELETLENLLKKAGFINIRFEKAVAEAGDGRIFVIATRD